MNISKNQLVTIGAILYGAAAVSAFGGVARHARPSTATARFMSDYDDSYPSDSSEDTHFTVEESSAEEGTIDVDNKPSTASETVVSSVMDYLPSSLASSGDISAEDRASINEAIIKLEALNPTEDPAYSPLLNGVYTLRYAGGYSESKIPSPTRELALFLYSGGYSPGLFALGLAQKLPSQLVELGDLEICKFMLCYLLRQPPNFTNLLPQINSCRHQRYPVRNPASRPRSTSNCSAGPRTASK